jgi:hypothetical protein
MENDGAAQYLNQPLHLTASVQSATVHPAPVENNLPERDSSPPSESDRPEVAPAPINPQVAEAAFPSEMLERRAKKKQSLERVRERSDRPRHRMKLHEIAFAIGLLAAGVGGAAYLGWYLLKPARTGPASADSTQSPPTPEKIHSPASILEAEFAEKPLPKRLVGRWELRNDDERRGWFELRSDSSMSAHAWVGDQAAQPTREHWFLNRETGDDYVIEIGQQIGAIGNLKYHLTMTGNDAFTITQIVDRAVRYRENQRFIRRGMPSSNEP